MRTGQGGAAGAKIQLPLTSASGTQLKFTDYHSKVGPPPHCRRSALNVGLLAEDRPDSEPLRMRAFDPLQTPFASSRSALCLQTGAGFRGVTWPSDSNDFPQKPAVVPPSI